MVDYQHFKHISNSENILQDFKTKVIMMNDLTLLQTFIALKKLDFSKMRSGTLVLLLIFFAQSLSWAEGSVDFRNYSGKRLFYWANEAQQIKVYAQSNEFINIGASHIGVNGGYAMVYRPDGSLAGIYQDFGLTSGIGIINNDVEELNGPTGGGLTNGNGYVPIAQQVMPGEEGIWTVVFGFSNTLPITSTFGFTNLENNEAWNRITNQPNEWAVVSWDVTVSQFQAGNFGGTLLLGRVFTNQYKTIITGNSNTTSPTFYMMTREGVQYQVDFNDMDPYGFDFVANSTGIVDNNGVPTYTSKFTIDYTMSDDPSSWTSGNFYIYDPQSEDQGGNTTHKIFFNTPDTNMPASAPMANAFSGDSYMTWLYNSTSSDALDVQTFDFYGVDNMGNPTCYSNYMESGVGGVISYTSNLIGSVQLSMDMNEDGDYDDPVDRVIYSNANIGANEIEWDGLDGMGNALALADGFEIDYQLEMRAGEVHILFRDIENNNGGITLTRMNGPNAPNNEFYYDHTAVGGGTSGGAAPSVTPTSTPYTYDSNWGNNKMLDYWAFQNISGNASGKLIVNVVTDCAKPVIVDTDGDGIMDDVDLDDDNDGIPDSKEFCNVAGGFTCFPNSIDPSGDEDGDLTPNYLDADDAMVANPCTDGDGNGICDNVAPIYDTDMDQVPDHLDLDADNDGIPDLIEAGHGQDDLNQDAKIDGVPADFGTNGLFNAISDDPNSTTAVILYSPIQTDANNIPDHDDLDSDDDGIFDVLEAPQTDGDYNGWVGLGTPKVDNNGLPFEDGNGNPVTIVFEPKDLDEDGVPDYRDWDRDGDGIADSYECPDQTDCEDSDNDGVFDIDELDSDGDGITDADECPNGSPCPDADNNSIDDFREFSACPTFGTPVVTADDEVICEGEVLGLSTSPVGGGVIYEWFYNNGTTSYSLGVTNSPNYFINFTNTSHTGAYSVQIKSGICSSDISNAVNINVYSTSPPISDNGTTASVPACEGESVQLSVPFLIDATYEWFGPNGFTSTQFDPVITNVNSDHAGSYYAVVTMSDACATVISTNTTVYVQAAPPAASVNAVNTVCEGQDLILTANPIGVPPSATINYEWFYQNGTSVGTTTATDFMIPNITAASSGDYYVVMTVGNCVAPASSMVNVNITSTATPNAGADQAICGLGNTSLNAAMPTVGTGVWTSPTGAAIFNPDSPQTDIANLNIGNNVFVWTLSNENCFNYATDTVVISYTNATSDEANAGVDIGVCDASTVTLNATNPSTAFGLWTQSSAQAQMGVSISNNTSATPNITGLVPGNTYTFNWTLSEGTCFSYDSDQVTITVSETPDVAASISLDEAYTCGEDQINLSATAPTIGVGTWTTTSNATIVAPNNAATMIEDLPTGGSMFVWTLSQGACVNYDADTIVVFSEEGIEVNDDEYMISLNERINNEDLLVNDVVGFANEIEINIVQEPTHGTVEMIDGIFSYTPNNNAFGVDQFEYEICNVNCPGSCEQGIVTITLNGLNEKGECWIPNVLTPNGNGKNDALIIPCTQQFPNNELNIFNRWGDKVYTTIGYQNDWEGTFNGNELPAGTYYYIFKTSDNDADPMQGFITISR